MRKMALTLVMAALPSLAQGETSYLLKPHHQRAGAGRLYSQHVDVIGR